MSRRDRRANEVAHQYFIPVNIFDGFSFLGIKLRNIIEASILSLIPAYFFFTEVPIQDITLKIIIGVVIFVPLAILASIGFNGESFTQFLRTIYLFVKHKRILEYEIAENEELDDPFHSEKEEIAALKAQLAECAKSEKKERKKIIRARERTLADMTKAFQQAEKEEEDVLNKMANEKREELITAAISLADQHIEEMELERGKKLRKKEKKVIYEQFKKEHVPVYGTQNKKKTRTGSVQEFMPVDRCERGVIVTKGGKHTRILAVTPINYPRLSAAVKNDTIIAFSQLLRGGPVLMKFKSLSMSANVDGFIERLVNQRNTEHDPKVIDMINNYIETLVTYGTENAISRQFLLIFEYDESVAGKNTSFEDRKNELDLMADKVTGYLKKTGNQVLNFEDDEKHTSFLFECFYNTLSRYNTQGYSWRHKIDYVYDQCISKNVELDATHFVSPMSIDFTHHKYTIVDGVYYGYLYISSSGYRKSTYGSWLFGLINGFEGVDVDITVMRQDRDKIKNAARRQINISIAQLQGTQNNNTDEYDELTSKAQCSRYVKDQMVEGDDFFYIVTMVTVMAYTEADLNLRMRHVTSLMNDANITVRPANFHQEDAFLSTLPICYVAPSIFSAAKRNMLSLGAASIYPFSSFEMMDANGGLLGINTDNGSLVMLDPFDTSKYRNASMAILGSSGAGKTYNLLIQALRSRLNSITTYIIAPLKGHEFRRCTEAVSGSCIRLFPGSKQNINFLDIRRVDSMALITNDVLDGGLETSLLAKKISSVETGLKLLDAEITAEEEQLINFYLMKIYGEKGITLDNDSLLLEWEEGRDVEMPTLRDLYNAVAEEPRLRRFHTILYKFVDGSASSFSNPTNVDLNNKFVVIDVSDLPDSLIPFGMYVALDFVWDKTKEDRTVPKRIFVDEIWRLTGRSAHPAAARATVEIWKTIRGFAGSAVAATQEISDLQGEYGQAILNNCASMMLMSLEEKALDIVADIMNLTVEEEETIRSLTKGQALLKAGSSEVVVRIIGSPKEHMLITTDAKEMRRLVDEELARRLEARRRKAEQAESESMRKPDHIPSVQKNPLADAIAEKGVDIIEAIQENRNSKASEAPSGNDELAEDQEDVQQAQVPDLAEDASAKTNVATSLGVPE